MNNKISFIVGNGNNGHCLELCIKSFMKHNSDHVSQIIISDNTSNDGSLSFIDSCPWKSIIKIVTYDYPFDRNATMLSSRQMHIDVGIKEAPEGWILLSHVDVEWKSNVVEKFYTILNNNPDLFMTGLGGDKPDDDAPIGATSYARFHECLLFLNKKQYIESGYSFDAKYDGKYSYDTGSYMYKQAWNSGKKLVPFDPEDPQDGKEKYLHHFNGGSYLNKKINSEKAEKILIERYSQCL